MRIYEKYLVRKEFLDAIWKSPGNFTLMLIFADWLRDQGEAELAFAFSWAAKHGAYLTWYQSEMYQRIIRYWIGLPSTVDNLVEELSPLTYESLNIDFTCLAEALARLGITE
jgi:uncharacterized protein (TIGR02996 family)